MITIGKKKEKVKIKINTIFFFFEEVIKIQHYIEQARILYTMIRELI